MIPPASPTCIAKNGHSHSGLDLDIPPESLKKKVDHPRRIEWFCKRMKRLILWVQPESARELSAKKQKTKDISDFHMKSPWII